MDSKPNYLFKLIKKNSFFNTFNDKEIMQIIDENGIFKKFEKKNFKIINEGDPCKSLFILLEGGVNVVRKSYKQEVTKLVILARLEKGSVFGEISLISNRSRISSVITNTNLTVVMEITEKNIKGFDANIQSKIYQQAIETLVERLDILNAEK